MDNLPIHSWNFATVEYSKLALLKFLCHLAFSSQLTCLQSLGIRSDFIVSFVFLILIANLYIFSMNDLYLALEILCDIYQLNFYC